MSRNTTWFAAAAFALMLAWTANLPAENDPYLDEPLAGKFTTPSGVSWVVATDDDGTVEGFLSGKGRFGQITGRTDGSVVHAYWFDDSDTAVCADELGGTRNWGRITFERQGAGMLRGFVGDCNDIPALPWTARR